MKRFITLLAVALFAMTVSLGCAKEESTTPPPPSDTDTKEVDDTKDAVDDTTDEVKDALN